MTSMMNLDEIKWRVQVLDNIDGCNCKEGYVRMRAEQLLISGAESFSDVWSLEQGVLERF